MEVYTLEVYGERGQMLHRRFAECSAREEAEAQAEDECDRIGGAYWEVRLIPLCKDATIHGNFFQKNCSK